jgi:hypothetical protein
MAQGLTDDDKQWLETRIQAAEDRLIENMRDMQTELLREMTESE